MKPMRLISWCFIFVYFLLGYSKTVNEGILKPYLSTIVYFGDEYTNKNTRSHIYKEEILLRKRFVIQDNTSVIKTINRSAELKNTQHIISSTSADVNDSFIRVGYESPDGIHRQLLLGFLPNSPADLNFNIGYDALMADARPDELFFEMPNDTISKYVIEGVGAYDNSYELPLGITMNSAGVHKIMIDAVENFTDSIYLKDVITGITHNLSAKKFIVNLPVGSYLNRYKLVFKNSYQPLQKILDLDNFLTGSLKCYFNHRGDLILKNVSMALISKVFIYNMYGQQIAERHISNNLIENSIPFYFNSGLYIIQVISENGIKTIKLLR